MKGKRIKNQILSNQNKKNLDKTERQKEQKQVLFNRPPIGLRNIGNTCFLNAIIQFLYGVQPLREILMKKMVQQGQKMFTISVLLGKIFFYLQKKNKCYYEQQKMIEELAQLLYTKNIRVSRYSQEDALAILLQILSLIQENHQKLIQAFDIETKSYCSCHSFISFERVLPFSHLTCLSCQSNIERKLISIPQNIIYLNSARQKIRSEIHEKGLNCELIYLYKAQIIYHGIGSFGHYLARRVQQKQQYQFDDSLVTLVKRQYGSDYLYSSPGLLLLYVFDKKIQASKPKLSCRPGNIKQREKIQQEQFQSKINRFLSVNYKRKYQKLTIKESEKQQLYPKGKIQQFLRKQ